MAGEDAPRARERQASAWTPAFAPAHRFVFSEDALATRDDRPQRRLARTSSSRRARGPSWRNPVTASASRPEHRRGCRPRCPAGRVARPRPVPRGVHAESSAIRPARSLGVIPALASIVHDRPQLLSVFPGARLANHDVRVDEARDDLARRGERLRDERRREAIFPVRHDHVPARDLDAHVWHVPARAPAERRLVRAGCREAQRSQHERRRLPARRCPRHVGPGERPDEAPTDYRSAATHRRYISQQGPRGLGPGPAGNGSGWQPVQLEFPNLLSIDRGRF